MPDRSPVIVKVGGSLYDLPDLGPRLLRLLDRPEMQPTFVVPGGGRLVDDIRGLDRLHRLGEEASHWLALSVNAVSGAMRMQSGTGQTASQMPQPQHALRFAS